MTQQNGANQLPRASAEQAAANEVIVTQQIGNSIVESSMPAIPDTTQYDRTDSRMDRSRLATAGVIGSGLVGGAALWVSGKSSSARFEQTMPFVEPLQRVVNDVQGVLSVTGGVSLAAAASAVLGVKVGAHFSPQVRAIDRWSSRDMSDDQLHPKRSIYQRSLEAIGAGKMPAKVAAGAYLAVLAATVSTEVSDGPQRPIETVMSHYAKDASMVVNYGGAMPMIESTITRPLADRVIASAHARGVKASIFDQNLGQMIWNGQTLSDLVLATPVPANSPVSYDVNQNCQSIPIAIDRSAGINKGALVELNGVTAKVVQEVDGLSATNRVGIEMDLTAEARCLKKDIAAPVHAVVIDAPLAESKEILAQANKEYEVSAVISKQHYLQNSKDFWEANVKPITSVLALFAGLFAASVGGANVRESLVRHRREWAAKLARGTDENTVRATEGFRVIKDGMVASIVGGGAAVFTAPIIVNTIESGFQASAGLKEFLVGSAVAITGSLAGAAKTLVKPSKVIRTEESIRS